MKKIILLALVLFVSVISTACINNMAVQELNNKAKTALDNGDYETAISRLKASIDLDGTIFETHYNLGIAYTQAEKYPEAVETFKAAQKLRPNFSDLYYSLGVADENFAKEIVDGSLKKNDKGVWEPVKKDQNSDNDNSDKVKLSKEDKAQVADLFNDAIESYNTYIQKAPSGNDVAEVQDKINYLMTQTHKYAPDKYSAPEDSSNSSTAEENYVRN